MSGATPPEQSAPFLFSSEVSTHSYQVRVEAFEGPLDLLLHLIRKNQVDIYDIPITDITGQYLQHLALMKELNLDVAGDFLVMASTLLQIKSRLLLPSYVDDEGGAEEEEDPRLELVRKLLEYERYRDAASLLDSRLVLGRDIFTSSVAAAQLPPADAEAGALEAMDIYALVDAFQQVLASLPADLAHEVRGDNFRVADRMADILSLLQERSMLTVQELCEGMAARDYVVATFLAVLELCKMRLLRIGQQRLYGTITIMAAVASVPGQSGEGEVW
jgi:segregation and condensation protein A